MHNITRNMQSTDPLSQNHQYIMSNITLDCRSLDAGELDESNLLKTMWFVYMANLCGLPSITINAGYSKSGE